jgi:L-lactate dehydrogenase (cytochrome)
MSAIFTNPVTAGDYRRLAQRRLPRFLFDYVDGGANQEDTLRANESEFRDFKLKQRVMRDVGKVDTSTLLSGRAVSMPVALAPVGLTGMMARRGEAMAARAAEASGIPFTNSTVSICSLEEVRETTAEPFWFQLYMLRDRDLVANLLNRAQDAACETLVFTVDLAVTGMRHRDVRNGVLGSGFTGSLEKAWQLLSHPRWLFDVGLKGKPHQFGNMLDCVTNPNDLDEFKAFIDTQFDPTVTWKDIAWLRDIWPGKLLIKGVLSGDDAMEAEQAGADGVIISNHGGRQLDGVASTISKVPEVATAVGDRIEVYMDGGVRSGVDVVKALALGARAVLIGRPWVWALAGRGEQGLIDLLQVFQREIAVAMALMGVNSISEISPDLIERPGSVRHN